MAATFSENIAAALRQIALDQIAQDLEIQQTYATKDELNNLGGGGSETAVGTSIKQRLDSLETFQTQTGTNFQTVNSEIIETQQSIETLSTTTAQTFQQKEQQLLEAFNEFIDAE